MVHYFENFEIDALLVNQTQPFQLFWSLFLHLFE